MTDIWETSEFRTYVYSNFFLAMMWKSTSLSFRTQLCNTLYTKTFSFDHLSCDKNYKNEYKIKFFIKNIINIHSGNAYFQKKYLQLNSTPNMFRSTQAASAISSVMSNTSHVTHYTTLKHIKKICLERAHSTDDRQIDKQTTDRRHSNSKRTYLQNTRHICFDPYNFIFTTQATCEKGKRLCYVRLGST